MKYILILVFVVIAGCDVEGWKVNQATQVCGADRIGVIIGEGTPFESFRCADGSRHEFKY